MDELERKVLQTIDRLGMIAPGQMVIAAVSGGADSLCMLHVLYALRRLREFELCVAHVNHSLRPTADEDERFVTKLGQTLGVTVYHTKEDVAGYAARQKCSVETAGREVRYRYFSQLREQLPNSVVATAHNANDSMESFLMHLMRGSGLTGLTGIPPVRDGVIRPLYRQNRSEIEQYCTRHGLLPCIDETNDCDDFTRNDIRHHVLPPILERCSGDSLMRTMDILAADDAFLKQYTEAIQKDYMVHTRQGVELDAKKLTALPLAIARRMVRLALPTQANLGLLHIDGALELAQANTGNKRIELPGGIVICLRKGKLIIEERGGSGKRY